MSHPDAADVFRALGGETFERIVNKWNRKHDWLMTRPLLLPEGAFRVTDRRQAWFDRYWPDGIALMPCVKA